MADLAVIIVTWNVRELVLKALQSLIADIESNGPEADIYIVDGASTDGTAEAIEIHFPQVRLIKSEKNLGFAACNNLALRTIGFPVKSSDNLPRAVYLLNPDTITHPNATSILFDTLMSNVQVGLVGARLSFGDGSFQHSAFEFPGLRQLWVECFPTPGRFIEGRFNGRYPRALYQNGQPFSVDFVLGATMMIRREVIQQTGMFDEQFFMYCEEIDWAWRIHQAGWDVWCVPEANVIHLGGQSTAQVRAESIVNLWKSRLRLFKKHYSPVKYRLAMYLITIGMRWKMRQLAANPLYEKESVLEAYRKVSRMALNPS
jgi:GT2 family glycosyltransferase